MSQLPDYKSLMLPLLHIAADGETSTRTAMRQLATTFDLPGARHAPMLRDGRSSILKHRAHWARIHMARAGLAPDVDAALCATLIDRILAMAHGPQGSAAFEQLGIDLLLALG